MKNGQLSTLLLVFTCCCFQAIAQDTIHWSPNRKLQWADFQCQPDTNSRNRSATSTGVNYSVRHRRKAFSFTVTTVFYKKKAWTKPGNSSYLLQHEQLHFDITELYARKLRQAFDNYNYTNPATIEADLDAIAISLKKERDKRNSRYDVETNYSLNTEKQREWNKMIAEELDRLAKYR